MDSYSSEHFPVEVQESAQALHTLLKEPDLEGQHYALTQKRSSYRHTPDASEQARFDWLETMMRFDIRPKWMALETLLVSPPDQREARFERSEEKGKRNVIKLSKINPLYRSVIHRNNRLRRLLELQAPSIIIQNEWRLLHKEVHKLFGETQVNTSTVSTSHKQTPLNESLYKQLCLAHRVPDFNDSDMTKVFYEYEAEPNPKSPTPIEDLKDRWRAVGFEVKEL